MEDHKLNYKRHSYTIPDFYAKYVELTKENPVYAVDFKLYKEIVSAYFKTVKDILLEEGRTYKLPCGLGMLFISKRKPNQKDRISVDFANTKKYGKTIFHLNEHTNGFRYKFYWNKTNATHPMAHAYNFVASRANKRQLCALIKEQGYDYIEY